MADITELDDALPPDLVHNIWFWFWQSLYWLRYALITILYVPWALAMHVVLLALAIPLLPLCSWRGGRKVFIYFYVVTVMLPGKFIWFNSLVRTRRRGRVWDFEMGRPRPIPLESRRRLSEDSERLERPDQSGSAFLTKLPPELRMLIYREIFVGGSDHLHIVQRKVPGTRTKPPTVKIKGYLCAREHQEPKNASCGCMLGSHAHHDPPHASELQLPKDYNRGKLALLQTCRQIYSEAVEMVYRKCLIYRSAHITVIDMCLRRTKILLQQFGAAAVLPPKCVTQPPCLDTENTNMLQAKHNDADQNCWYKPRQIHAPCSTMYLLQPLTLAQDNTKVHDWPPENRSISVPRQKDVSPKTRASLGG